MIEVIGMFIKLQRERKSNKVRVNLVQGYRDLDGKSKSRIIKHYGLLDELLAKDPDILDKLKAGAKQANQKQLELKPMVELDLTRDYSGDKIRNWGWLLVQAIYNSLQLKPLLSKFSKKRKIEYDLSQVLLLLVTSRLLDPNSKYATCLGQDNYLLLRKHLQKPLTTNDIYRSLNQIYLLKSKLQVHAHEQLKKYLGRQAQMVFYDVTNYYFASDKISEDVVDGATGQVLRKGLKKRGYSKENRKTPIVQMGLFLDSQGIPICYQLFPGNLPDAKTLTPIIDEVKKQYGFSKIVVVADKALNSKTNTSTISSGGDGWIFSQKIRGATGVDKKLQEFALSRDGWSQIVIDGETTFATKSYLRERLLSSGETIKEKVVAVWSRKYALREYRRRQEAIAWAQKIIDTPEALRTVIKKGGKGLIKHELKGESSGETQKAKHLLSLDKKRIEELEKWDGLNMLVTSQINLSDEQILTAYHGLWQIEESFKITKSQLEGRPVFVWTDKHIEAHFLTCFLALLILRLLQKKVKDQTGVTLCAPALISGLKQANAAALAGGYYKLFKNEHTSTIEKAFAVKFNHDYCVLSNFTQLRKTLNKKVQLNKLT